jgi:hypothetical protein
MRKITREEWRKRAGHAWVNTYYTQSFPDKATPVWSVSQLWVQMKEIERDIALSAARLKDEFTDKIPSEKLAGIITDPIVLQKLDEEDMLLRIDAVYAVEMMIDLWTSTIDVLDKLLDTLGKGISSQWSAFINQQFGKYSTMRNAFRDQGWDADTIVIRMDDYGTEMVRCLKKLSEIRADISDHNQRSNFYWEFRDEVTKVRKYIDKEFIYETGIFKGVQGRVYNDWNELHIARSHKWCEDKGIIPKKRYGIIIEEMPVPEWRSETDYDMVNKELFERYKI